ncbi:MAG: hypothetical protein ABJI96_09430 [Paracoccaceae bacterium]
MKFPVLLNTSLVAATLAVVATNVPSQSLAEEFNMCDLHAVPEQIKRKVTRRADYDDILRLMFSNCPEAALALTEAATAAIGTTKFPIYERLGDPSPGSVSAKDDGNNGGGNNGGGNNGGGNNGGGNNGGGNNGGGNNGGGNNGGGDNGGGNDGDNGGSEPPLPA